MSDPYVSLYLLEHGADVNAADDKGMSALLAVAGRGNAAVGADSAVQGSRHDPQDRDGKTAWHLAAERRDRKMMQLLEKSGARPQWWEE